MELKIGRFKGLGSGLSVEELVQALALRSWDLLASR